MCLKSGVGFEVWDGERASKKVEISVVGEGESGNGREIGVKLEHCRDDKTTVTPVVFTYVTSSVTYPLLVWSYVYVT